MFHHTFKCPQAACLCKNKIICFDLLYIIALASCFMVGYNNYKQLTPVSSIKHIKGNLEK